MLTLAVDCALRRINLGASDGDEVLGELSADAGTRQAELLPGAVSGFLALFGRSVRDVGRVAVTCGPGYYTGIRVGLSYASALAESVGAPLAGVSTLLAMALPLMEILSASGAPADVASVIPAGRDSLYAAVYGAFSGDPNDSRGAIFGPSHIKTDDFARLALSGFSERNVVVTGFGPLPAGTAARCAPTAGVARGILAAARNAVFSDPALVRAVYLRPPY